MAACLWGGEGTVASHLSAAALWGLDGFEQGPVEVSSGKQKKLESHFKVHRPGVPHQLTTSKLGIPVTNAARTLADLAAVLHQERMDRVLDDALRKGLTSIAALRRLLRRDTEVGRRGTARLARLLDLRSPGYQPSASEFQHGVRTMLMTAGLTGFVEEMDIHDGEGKFVARPDFVFPTERVIVEADGRRDHSGRADFNRDLRRRNRLTRLRWLVVHVTWDDLKHRRDEVLEEIRGALAGAG